MSRSRALLVCAAALAAACEPVLPDTATTGSALRPDHPNAPSTEPGFDLGEVVESWVSPAGRVRVHFTRTGRNAVPAADADGSGTPDYVELAGRTYDNVRTLYHGPLGLREPVSDALLGGSNDGGDDLFDVYLVDFGGRGDGAFRREACEAAMPGECTGYMSQENDFVGYGYPSLQVACNILASHEYFHAVQAAYDADQDVIFTEATAVWATERFDPSLRDFEGFIDAYLSRPDRPLNVVSGGVVDAKSYGTGIFFQFLSERFDPLVVPKLLDEVVDGANGVADPMWFDRLDPFLAANYSSSFAAAFSEFSIWNLYTGQRADGSRSYRGGAGYPIVAIEDVTLPYELRGPRFFSASTKYFGANPDGRAAVTAALVVGDDRLDQLDKLSLYLAAVRNGRVDDPMLIADPRAGTETLDTAGAQLVLALVVNTNQEGNSKRPDVCIGTTEEVAACATVEAPDAGVEDSGADLPDSGTGGSDAGVSDTGSMMPPSGDGGCTAVRGDGIGLWMALMAALAIAAAARRRGSST